MVRFKCPYTLAVVPVRFFVKVLLLSSLLWIALTSLLLSGDKAPASLSSIPPGLMHKDIYILTAHPDDEVMFLGPTILELSAPRYGNRMHLHCLSTGNDAGLGAIREAELHRAALMLFAGSVPPVAVSVVDDETRFRDAMDVEWDPAAVARELASVVASPRNSVIITFDSLGVSGHPNHILLYRGACQYAEETGTALYLLESAVSVGEKYSFTLLTNWKLALRALHASPLAVVPAARAWLATLVLQRDASRVEIYANVNMFLAAVGAMAWGHFSQMVWFRYGWLVASRYLTFNVLVQHPA